MNDFGMDPSSFGMPLPPWEAEPQDIENYGITDIELAALGIEELEQSSIESLGRESEVAYIDAEGPSLPEPNYDLLASEISGSRVAPEDLTDDAIAGYLEDIPEFEAFLDAQNHVDQAEIYDGVRQKILENPGSTYSAETLAATALTENMQGVWQATGDPAVKEMMDNTRAEILVDNNPAAQALIDAKQQSYIDQGMSPAEAKKLAVSETLSELDAELSENGVTTPFNGTHPEMDAAIASLLVAELGGTAEAMEFVGDLNSLVEMEGKFVGLFEAMANVKSEEASGDLGLENGKKIIKGANELIDEAMAQLDKVPIPGEQKNAILSFMAAISEALATLEKVMTEIGMAQAKRSKEEFASKVDAILAGLRDTIAQLEKESKKAKKAGKKLGPLGDLGGTLDILGPLVAAIMMVVVIVAIAAVIVLASVLAIFTFGISLLVAAVLLPMLMVLLASIVISLIVKEEGKTDNMMKALMTAVKEILKVMDIEASDQVIAAIIAVAIVVTLIIATFLSGPAALALLPFAFQFVPEMIVRTGVLGMVAEKFGSAVGMKEKEILKLETRLRLVTAMSSMGMQSSSSFESLTQEKQDDLITGKRSITKLSLARSKERRVGAHAGAGLTQTLNDIAREQASSPEELAKMQEEIQQMIAILAKLVTQLKALLAALIAGGSPAAMNDAIKSIEDLISGEMAKFVMPSGSDLGVKTPDEESGENAALARLQEESSSDDKSEFMPLFGSLTGSLLEALPYFHPSEETMKQNQEDLKERQMELMRRLRGEENQERTNPNEIFG